MVGLHVDEDGGLYRGELRVPPSIDYWDACWMVLQTAMIMINAADPSPLIRYSKHIK